jgi:hypothetical protein
VSQGEVCLLPDSSEPVQRVGLPRVAAEFSTGTKTASGTAFPSNVVGVSAAAAASDMGLCASSPAE